MKKYKYKGKVGVCSLGCLGLITEEELKEVAFPDGQRCWVRVGFHLTDKISPIGSPWCSRNPIIIGSLEDIIEEWDG